MNDFDEKIKEIDAKLAELDNEEAEKASGKKEETSQTNYDSKVLEIISEYKKRTKKECYFIKHSNEVPGILDDKFGGIPYLPVGEEYPKDKYGNPMSLLIQVNLGKLNLEGYPKGIFELFVTTHENDLFGYEIEEGSFEMRLYDEGLEYQTSLPEVKLEAFLEKPFKIEFNKGTMSLPYNMGDKDAINLLLNLFEEKYNTKVNYPMEIETLFNVNYFDLQEELNDGNKFASNIGGYASFVNDPDADYYSDEGSFIFISSDLDDVFKLGNAYSFYVLISKENLMKKNFAEATCNFEWS